jgi:cytochrome c553
MEPGNPLVSRAHGHAHARLAAQIVITLMLVLAPLAVQAGEDAKQVFLDARCDRCHGVATAGVEARKPRASDLSHAGATRDAAWIRDYILRNELIDDSQHPVAWKGSDAELDTLVAWLASLD